MNDKRVVLIAGELVVLLLGVSMFFLLKNKLGRGKEVQVTIRCSASETTGGLRVNDTFNCNITNKNYTFTVTSVDNDKIVFKSSDYGLTYTKEDGTINLVDKVDTFELAKGKTLKICPQATDSTCPLTIEWK